MQSKFNLGKSKIPTRKGPVVLSARDGCASFYGQVYELGICIKLAATLSDVGL